MVGPLLRVRGDWGDFTKKRPKNPWSKGESLDGLSEERSYVHYGSRSGFVSLDFDRKLIFRVLPNNTESVIRKTLSKVLDPFSSNLFVSPF